MNKINLFQGAQSISYVSSHISLSYPLCKKLLFLSNCEACEKKAKYPVLVSQKQPMLHFIFKQGYECSGNCMHPKRSEVTAQICISHFFFFFWHCLLRNYRRYHYSCFLCYLYRQRTCQNVMKAIECQ